VITVNPLPTATITGTTAVVRMLLQHLLSHSLVQVELLLIHSLTRSTADLNLTVVSTGDVATVTAPTTAAGTFTYLLVKCPGC